MKNKTLLIKILSIFLFSIAGIGIVFASNNLLKISGAKLSERTLTADAEVMSYEDDIAVLNTVFHNKDDYVVYKIIVENTDKKDYLIKSISDNNENENISYEFLNYKDVILKAGKKNELLVKVKYSKELTNMKNRIDKSTITLTLELTDVSGNVINPQTLDYVFMYVNLFIVSLITLLFILRKCFKEKNTRRNVVSILVLTIGLIPLAVKATDAVYSTASIKIESNVQFMDKVKVTFIADGEKTVSYVPYNSLLEKVDGPVKSGYAFKGWYIDDAKFDFSTHIKEDIALTAKYIKEEYSITYNYNGGNAQNPSSYKITDYPTLLTIPTKDGYAFTGWTDQDGNTAILQFVSNQAKDLEYTANYVPIPYTISYEDITDEEKTTLSNPESYLYSDTVTLNNPSNRNDSNGDLKEKFVGWKDDNGNVSKTVSFTNQTDNKSFDAEWVYITPDTYTITYNLNNGELEQGKSNPNSYSKISDTFKLNNPSRRGYEFNGWYGSNGATRNKELYVEQGTVGDLEYNADFSIINYPITYTMNGGDNKNNPSTYTVLDEVTLETPTKNGYRFDGWLGTDLNGLSPSVTIPANSIGERHYEARFTAETYDIDYILHDGVVNGTNPIHYTVDDTVTLINPTKEGNDFVGWKLVETDETFENVSFTGETGNKTYEAIFVSNSYKVAFDKNDNAAIGEMNEVLVPIDQDYTLPDNAFTKNGYKFVKWSTNPDGTGTVILNKGTINNLVTSGTITLYANWEIATNATFLSGKEVNNKIKTLANNGSNVAYNAEDKKIKKVKYSTDIPQEFLDNPSGVSSSNIVSTNRSEKPIYIWYDSESGTIYYGSQADNLHLGSSCSFMFNYMRSVTEIDTNFDTNNCTNMEQMFWGDNKLAVLEVHHFNTSNVTTMRSMFGENSSMPSFNINNWDVSNVKNFNFMFNQCASLTSLDLSNWVTTAANEMQNMFSSTDNLKTLKIDRFDTSHVTNMVKMFDNTKSLESLDLSNFDTSQVKSFLQFLRNSESLTYLNLTGFKTDSATNMTTMFQNSGLTTIDVSSFNTTNVTTFSNMFSGMKNLQTIYASTSFVTTGQTSTGTMFDEDTNLVGGSGTHYSNKTSTYARIDEPENNKPGYFTKKN